MQSRHPCPQRSLDAEGRPAEPSVGGGGGLHAAEMTAKAPNAVQEAIETGRGHLTLCEIEKRISLNQISSGESGILNRKKMFGCGKPINWGEIKIGIRLITSNPPQKNHFVSVCHHLVASVAVSRQSSVALSRERPSRRVRHWGCAQVRGCQTRSRVRAAAEDPTLRAWLSRTNGPHPHTPPEGRGCREHTCPAPRPFPVHTLLSVRRHSSTRRGPHCHRPPRPPPPSVTFRRVVVSLRGPGQSPVLPSACCVGSLRSDGRCGGVLCGVVSTGAWSHGAQSCHAQSPASSATYPRPPTPLSNPRSGAKLSPHAPTLHSHPDVSSPIGSASATTMLRLGGSWGNMETGKEHHRLLV